MPSVVTFWQLPEDEIDFVDFLQSTGSVLALPTNWLETKEALIPQPLATFIERNNPDQLLFGPEIHVLQASVEQRELDGRVRFGVLDMKSCVACYRRGMLRNGRLAQSNLSAYLEYPTEDAAKLARKDEDFVAWVGKVFGWVRKATPERVERNGYRYRATKRVKTAVSEGKLEAVLY